YFPNIFQLAERDYLAQVIPLYLERIHLIPEFSEQAACFFSEWPDYDVVQVSKKFKPSDVPLYTEIFDRLKSVRPFEREGLKSAVEMFVAEKNTKFGVVLPTLRLAIAGILRGPDLFAMMEVLGAETVSKRLDRAMEIFPTLINSKE